MVFPTKPAGWFWTGMLLAGLMLVAAGCAKPAPAVKLYQVKGTVLYKGGGPLAGGSISFQPTTTAGSPANATIKADGTFALATPVSNTRVEGAAEGVYRVTVLPPLAADHSTPVVPITLEQTFQVEPRDNQLRIEVEPGPQRH